MNRKQREQLEAYAALANILVGSAEMNRWVERVIHFAETGLGAEAAVQFRTLRSANVFDTVALTLGHIEGLIAANDDIEARPLGSEMQNSDAIVQVNSRKVFIVHGHDREIKEAVARFIEKLGLEPIILHEQPNQGRTIIEKFEVSSNDVAFAVVLLTPDDVGGEANSQPQLHPRARQNVILEFGYFIGRLGRTRVCALHKGGVELPSDYQGVLYIEFDPTGAWKSKLAQEFVEAKLIINLQALLGGS